MSLGVRFFILQISSVLLFSTTNILISQFFSPAEVVPYNIAYKYYNLLAVAFAILLTPFWSAYTEAYTKKDFQWIYATMRRLHQAWGVLVLCVLVFTVFANDFYYVWVGSKVTVPREISIAMAFYVLMTSWSAIYANFINGTGKIQLQMYIAILISILNIPFAYFLVTQLNLGVVGIILAPTLLLLMTSIIWPMQVKRILTNTGHRIWFR